MIRELFKDDQTAFVVESAAAPALRHCIQEGILPLEYPLRETLETLPFSGNERLFYLLSSGGSLLLGVLVLIEAKATGDFTALTAFLHDLPARYEEKMRVLTAQLNELPRMVDTESEGFRSTTPS